jgi:RNA polymerase sigma factor (sigma-70 family)
VNARSAESLAMLSVEHQAVVDALSGLAPRQREVLVLRYYGGLSEAEIAEATGISKGAVKSTASRALDSVADILARADGPMGRR